MGCSVWTDEFWVCIGTDWQTQRCAGCGRAKFWGVYDPWTIALQCPSEIPFSAVTANPPASFCTCTALSTGCCSNITLPACTTRARIRIHNREFYPSFCCCCFASCWKCHCLNGCATPAAPSSLRIPCEGFCGDSTFFWKHATCTNESNSSIGGRVLNFWAELQALKHTRKRLCDRQLRGKQEMPVLLNSLPAVEGLARCPDAFISARLVVDKVKLQLNLLPARWQWVYWMYCMTRISAMEAHSYNLKNSLAVKKARKEKILMEGSCDIFCNHSWTPQSTSSSSSIKIYIHTYIHVCKK